MVGWPAGWLAGWITANVQLFALHSAPAAKYLRLCIYLSLNHTFRRSTAKIPALSQVFDPDGHNRCQIPADSQVYLTRAPLCTDYLQFRRYIYLTPRHMRLLHASAIRTHPLPVKHPVIFCQLYISTINNLISYR
jgi:hypothetical protein